MHNKKKAVVVIQVASKPENFSQYVAKAELIMNSWPSWKRATRATSYPRYIVEPSHK